MAADKFSRRADDVSTSSRAPFAIVPNDGAELSTIPKALYIGTGGNLVVRGIDSTADVTFKNVPAGATIDVRAQYVRATGTTAADIIGLA